MHETYWLERAELAGQACLEVLAPLVDVDDLVSDLQPVTLGLALFL